MVGEGGGGEGVIRAGGWVGRRGRCLGIGVRVSNGDGRRDGAI